MTTPRLESTALPSDLADAIAGAAPRLGRLGTRVLFYPVAASTNDVAAAIAVEGAVVVADEQTAGRGRRGHTWFSPPGSGLYVSVVLQPGRARPDADRATAVLTLAAGVGIAEGIAASTGLRVDLKWPNDLFAGRRKLGGILAEADLPFVTLGYGINVSAVFPPSDIAARVTSLETELGRPIDRGLVLAETLAGLSRRYDDLLEGRVDAILDAWRSLAPGAIGAPVSWAGPAGEQRGVTAGIDDRGALLVNAGGRIERIVAGELKWL
ncbi:MAG TPA: biotin--[acetyl-CoA-carboxylase] ligase [Vicinamibacterales bacterium]|nr:biotin--[acetyl-CoA-carboxylase] ligase [Vicinamibacterales bacterium]